MENMFSGCKSLTSLNLNIFETDNVLNMNKFFSDCINLAFIDISNFNMRGVESYNLMFYNISEKGHIIYNGKFIPDEVIKQIPEKWEKTNKKN